MVFTGIVSTVGKAVFNKKTQNLHVGVEDGGDFWKNCASGDSIAINGCCLTILASTNTKVGTFFVMEESRSKTNILNVVTTTDDSEVEKLLDGAAGATPVNLEKALKFGDHLGGNVLSGHIDGVASIVEIIPHDDGSKSFWIDLSEFPPGVAVVVDKGSIAIDGVSFTVAELKAPKLKVSVTPYTLNHTRLQFGKVGDKVNVEFDQTLKLAKVTSLSGKPSGWTKVEELPTDLKKAKDEELMKIAIEMGELGRQTASPNPWVGCVMTDPYGNILGKGFHAKAGQNHAEINAIQDAISNGNEHQLEGSTCYTTLEPCSNHGRTGPCDQFLLKHKIGRVVIAIVDPDKLVCGTGIQHLLEAGVHVSIGVMETKARESLRSYLHHRSTGLPWVIYKVACSLDGKIAVPDKTSNWITGEEARKDVHQRFRANSQAIIVGSNTAQVDNPSLTVRSLPKGCDGTLLTQPLRVIIGSKPFRLGGNLLDTKMAPTILFTTKEATVPEDWEAKGVQVQRVGDIRGHADFGEVLAELGKRGVLQVLVEGGSLLGSDVLEQDYVNELVIYQAPLILGKDAWPWSVAESRKSLPTKSLWILKKVSTHGEDVCMEYERSG